MCMATWKTLLTVNYILMAQESHWHAVIFFFVHVVDIKIQTATALGFNWRLHEPWNPLQLSPLRQNSGFCYRRCKGDGIFVSLGNAPTVLQTEVFVILAGISTLSQKAIIGKIMNYLTDSQAECKTFASCSTKSKVVEEFKDRLNKLAGHNKVNVWIPSHKIIPSNKGVDDMI